MKYLIRSLKFLAVFTLLTGFAYPLMITALAQLLFHGRANGSLVIRDSKIIGSELIGQQFDSVIYFSSRPSATGYNPMPSGASNLGPGSTSLNELVKARANDFVSRNHLPASGKVPSEMLFSSGSGLDPDISLEAAYAQSARVEDSRHFNSRQREQLRQIIKRQTCSPFLLLPGEARVNVLFLNLCTDTIR